MRIIEVTVGEINSHYILQKRISTNLWRDIMESKSYNEVYKKYLELLNPIKDGRIVNDVTFAFRLKSLLNEIKTNCDNVKELIYLNDVANDLLQYQKHTVKKNSEEEVYLRRMGVL